MFRLNDLPRDVQERVWLSVMGSANALFAHNLLALIRLRKLHIEEVGTGHARSVKPVCDIMMKGLWLRQARFREGFLKRRLFWLIMEWIGPSMDDAFQRHLFQLMAGMLDCSHLALHVPPADLSGAACNLRLFSCATVEQTIAVSTQLATEQNEGRVAAADCLARAIAIKARSSTLCLGRNGDLVPHANARQLMIMFVACCRLRIADANLEVSTINMCREAVVVRDRIRQAMSSLSSSTTAVIATATMFVDWLHTTLMVNLARPARDIHTHGFVRSIARAVARGYQIPVQAFEPIVGFDVGVPCRAERDVMLDFVRLLHFIHLGAMAVDGSVAIEARSACLDRMLATPAWRRRVLDLVQTDCRGAVFSSHRLAHETEAQRLARARRDVLAVEAFHRDLRSCAFRAFCNRRAFTPEDALALVSFVIDDNMHDVDVLQRRTRRTPSLDCDGFSRAVSCLVRACDLAEHMPSGRPLVLAMRTIATTRMFWSQLGSAPPPYRPSAARLTVLIVCALDVWPGRTAWQHEAVQAIRGALDDDTARIDPRLWPGRHLSKAMLPFKRYRPDWKGQRTDSLHVACFGPLANVLWRTEDSECRADVLAVLGSDHIQFGVHATTAMPEGMDPEVWDEARGEAALLCKKRAAEDGKGAGAGRPSKRAAR